MKTQRIIGIDVARAFAIIGMIIVNFKIVFGTRGTPWLKEVADVFDGKAAATFVVLAGVGLALMTNKAYHNHNSKQLRLKRKQIFKRALLLFVIGLSYIVIWPADILHFYGIYMLVTLLFIGLKPAYSLIGSLLTIFLFPVLLVLFNYESGWNFETLEYLDFWTAKGFIRHLFYNGFHPVFPWVAFMLFGLWLGRQDLTNSTFLKRMFWIGLCVFIGVQTLSLILINTLPINADYASEILPLFTTDPMPPLPLYMLNGLSISTVVITSCILFSERFKHYKIILALNNMGQLALTFYVAHVIIGMGLIELFNVKPLGEYTITFSVIYALMFSLSCILFSVFWLKHKTQGPLEWIMRKLI